MKLNNVSGTLEEAARIVCRMSQEERDEFYKEMFKYNPSRPCVESASNVSLAPSSNSL
jgi:hypothetical protein